MTDDTQDDLGLLLIENLLDWPFLGFLLLVICGLKFHKPISDRIGSVTELTLGGKTKIVLGSKEIAAHEIGDALTSAFRELEARVERIEAHESFEQSEQHKTELDEPDGQGELPQGLQAFLWENVYKMLNSDYWFARYVDTLAKNTSVSEDAMLKFLKERPDVEVFKDGDRWAANLKSRSMLWRK